MLHQPVWHQATSLFLTRAPTLIRPWLIDKQSLTARLRCACTAQFRVQLLDEQWTRIPLSERRALGLGGDKKAYVRQVHLYCGDTPWVYARTVIPQQSLRGKLYGLTKLGNKSLGSVLFAEPTMQRGLMEIAHVSADSLLYTTALGKQDASGDAIWGRRSVFNLFGGNLLVNEFFLPAFLQHLTTQVR